MSFLDDLLKKAQQAISGAGQAVLNASPAAPFFKSTVPFIQQGLQNFGQDHSTASKFITDTFQQPAEKVTRFFEDPYKEVTLPEYKSKNPSNLARVLELATNSIAKPVAEGVINAPRNYVGGITRTGEDIGRMTQGEKVPVRKLLGDTASIGKSILDVSLGGQGKNLAKGAADVAMNMGLKDVIKIGAKEGAKFGGKYGLAQGLMEYKDVNDLLDYSKNVLGSTVEGGVTGGIFGGVLAGGGHSVGKIWGTINEQLSKFFPEKSPEEIAQLSRKYLRDEVGRFSTGPTKNEPVFYGDLREKLGLPRSGVDNPIGLQTRPKGGSEAIYEAERLKKGVPLDKVFGIEKAPLLGEVGKPFDFSQKLGDKEYKVFNDAFQSAQNVLDINPELREVLPKNISGKEAYSRINGAISMGSEAFELIDDITRGLKDLGYEGIIKPEGKSISPKMKELGTVVQEQKIPVKEQISALRQDRKLMKKGQPLPLEDIFKKTETTLPEAPSQYVDDIRNALYTEDNKTAQEIYNSLSKEYTLPTLESLTEEVKGAQNQAMGGAKQEVATKYGDYQDIAQKMKNFLNISAEKTDKKTGELFREHIPGKIFGVSSDEIASSLGMSESQFMSDLTKDLKIVSSGNATKKQIQTFSNKITKLKTLYDKLDPNFFKVMKDWENKVSAVSVEPTMQTKQKVMQRAMKDEERMAKIDFENWQKQVFADANAAKKTADPLKKVTDLIKNQTGSPLSKNVQELKDISGFQGQARDVYRNFKQVFGPRFQEAKAVILDPFDRAKGNFVKALRGWEKELDDNIVKKFNITKGSRESSAVQEYGEGNLPLPELVAKFGKAKANDIVRADQWFRSKYDQLLSEVNATRAQIYPGQEDKIIPRRSDYYRHFTEMAQGISGLINIFDTPANISSSLAGVSEGTKPKSKWLSFAQKRMGFLTKIDAVAGFIDYVKAAEYAKNIDPQTAKFRALREELANVTGPDTENPAIVNNFLEFLDDFSNDLAGKTNPGDRWAQKIIPGGRQSIRALNWLNSRVKSNVILGNLSSSVAQIFNVPQGIANAGPVNAYRGLGATVANIFGEATPIKKSDFISERYGGDVFKKFDQSLVDNGKKMASWVTSILDEVGTKYIWNSHYAKAIAEGIKDPIKFADDQTRNMVAGRGIGEVPLAQKSLLMKFGAPFQLEVGNLWHVMKEWTDEKQFGKLATFFVASYLFNQGAKAIRGSDVSFDPINAGIEAYQEYQNSEDKKMGALKAGGRMLGEVISNIPFGQSVAGIYPEYGPKINDTQLPTRKEFFGEGDPTRFGTGLLTQKGLEDPLFKVLPPFGGQQLERTIEGIMTVAKGFSENKGGEIQTPVEQSPSNYIKAGTFGKNSLPEMQDFFNNDRKALSEGQSDFVRNSNNPQSDYQSIMSKRDLSAQEDKVKEQLKTEGGASAVGDKIFYNDSGEIKSINIAKVASLPSATPYDKAVKQNEAYKLLDNVKDLPEEQQASVLKKLEISPDEAGYYSIASQPESVRYVAVAQALQGSKDPVKDIIPFLRTINGKPIANSGVIDQLYEDGVINKEEKKYLNALKWDETKQKFNTDRDYKASGDAAAKKKAKAIASFYQKNFTDLNKIFEPQKRKQTASNVRNLEAVLRSTSSGQRVPVTIDSILKKSAQIAKSKPYTVK